MQTLATVHETFYHLHIYTNTLYSNVFEFTQNWQIDGVAMGSPLGPTLANFFLAHIESKIFAEHKNYYPKLYCRYVDDIFAIFDKQDAIIEFFKTSKLKIHQGTISNVFTVS